MLDIIIMWKLIEDNKIGFTLDEELVFLKEDAYHFAGVAEMTRYVFYTSNSKAAQSFNIVFI